MKTGTHAAHALAARTRACLLALTLSLLTGSAHAANALTLLFAGDLMLDDGPGRVIAAGKDPLAAFDTILQQADFRIANLETPVATSGKPLPNKIYTFRSAPAALNPLVGRFDAVSLANNHSGDYGPAAFLETIQRLDAAGIRHFGGGKDLAAAHTPLWIAKNGLKIAVLGYNEYKPRSFEAGATWPGVAWSEDSQVLADIRAAKDAGADLVIPFMHWGWENEPAPSPRLRAFARTLIDAGAAAVVGGHPHCTQGAEIYRGKPIIYSLGNFIFDGFDTVPGRTGWLLRLHLDKSGVTRWDTLEAHLDDDGIPHPAPTARTPCAKRGDKHVQACPAP